MSHGRVNAPQPWALAVCRHVAKVEGAMYPLVASPDFAGLPITTLDEATPLAMIWNTALPGHVLEDAVKSPLQVVYSDVPSAVHA